MLVQGLMVSTWYLFADFLQSVSIGVAASNAVSINAKVEIFIKVIPKKSTPSKYANHISDYLKRNTF